MLNFIVIMFTVPLMRKYLQTATQKPELDTYLRWIRVAAAILFGWSFLYSDKYSPTIEFFWDSIYFILLYFLYKNKSNRIASVLLFAAIPFVLCAINDDLVKFWLPTFYENNDEYFKIAEVIGLIWMFAFGLGASNQHKAFLVEQKKREEEEEQNKLVLNRRDELEVMVAERTAELTTQKEELEKTVEELKTTQTQLIQKEKMASLGELTAGIAHEIQNPLNFVNNFSEVSVELIQELTEEKSKDKAERDEELENEILGDLIQNLQKITYHGKRASSIVKGMLEHSRASTGERQISDINALADEYLRLSYHGLRAKDKSFNADFKAELNENLPKLNIVPQDVGRVLLNLFNNAFYEVQQKSQKLRGSEPPTDYRPKVSVSTQHTENHVVIKVSDNANGIPENIKSKIFQPFFTTKPTGEGTGLGLSLSYDIITKGHSGTMEVESVEGEGTTFIIKLPIS